MPSHTRERYSIRLWVDKYRTGSGSDRVEHSPWLVLLHCLRSELYVESMTRSLPLPVLYLSRSEYSPLPIPLYPVLNSVPEINLPLEEPLHDPQTFHRPFLFIVVLCIS